MQGVGGINPQYSSVQRGILDHQHGLVAPAVQGVEPQPLGLREHPKPGRTVEGFYCWKVSPFITTVERSVLAESLFRNAFSPLLCLPEVGDMLNTKC